MFSKGPVLALVLLVRSSSGYRQPYEYLEALDVFGAAYVFCLFYTNLDYIFSVDFSTQQGFLTDRLLPHSLQT